MWAVSALYSQEAGYNHIIIEWEWLHVDVNKKRGCMDTHAAGNKAACKEQGSWIHLADSLAHVLIQ